MYLDNSFQIFFDDLASNKSSPGGGSVAALTGVQAASLILMVARLTIGKKKYDHVQTDVEEIINQTNPLKDSLMKKVEEDIQVFQKIMAVYKLPKEQRPTPLRNALTKSAYFSFEMLEEGFQLLKLAYRVGEIGNKNLVSDAAIATLLAMTCIESSVINVNINLNSLNNHEITKELHEKMINLVDEAKTIKQKAIQFFDQYLKLG